MAGLRSKLKTIAVLARTGGWRACWHRGRRTLGEALGNRAGRARIPAESTATLSPFAPHVPEGVGDEESVVVFTANIGGYDTLHPCLAEGVDRVCFTGSTGLEIPGWRQRRIQPELEQTCAVRSARCIKTMAHKWFPEQACSIWLDANLQLAADPRQLVARYLQDADIAMPAHPERACTYQEAEMVKYLELDDAAVVDAQMQRYRDEMFPRRFGLLETSIVIRRHTPAVAAFNELWWGEIEHGSCRDQLSVMYALWRSGIRCMAIPGGRETTSIATFHPHKRSTTT